MAMMAPSGRNSCSDWARTSSSMPAGPEQLEGAEVEVSGAGER